MSNKLLAPERLLEMLGVREHPGWSGAFSTLQFPGAIPNGTPIEKVKEDAGHDIHAVGSRGKVLGSIQALPISPIMYFVEWDSTPKCAFACVDWKIAPVRQ